MKIIAVFLFVVFAVSGGSALGQSPGAPSPITNAHIREINHLFTKNGINGGFAVRDARDRVELQGSYQDEREVDRAFSLAQTVVGVRWVSPITPQNIKVKEWEGCVSKLLGGEKCGPGTTAPPPAGIAPVPSLPRAQVPDVEQSPGPVANKYALVVGVGRFQNPIQPLQYANKDAYDFYSYLLDPRGGTFKRENVILLRDEYATREAVKRGLDEIRRRSKEDDLVLLYFSSHGTPPDKYGGVHLVTFDSEVRPRERIWESSLTEGLLRDFIQEVKAKRLVVVMDACYSNGAYGQVAGFLPPGGKSLDAGLDEGYGRSRRDMAQRLLGAKDLVLDEESPVTPGPAPASARWGKVLISASDAGERSWESDTLRNSVFTRYFIEGLRANGGAIKEAFEYARARVPLQVKREKGAEITQIPQLTSNRKEWNMSLAISER
jgi:hypothetical protein